MTVPEMKLQFCKKLLDLRRKNNLTLPELARRSGVPLTMLEELDRGVVPESMMVDDAWKLAKVFDCELHELFRQAPEPSK